MKYKNKEDIELNFGGMSKAGRDGSGVTLVQEVISEAITMLEDIPGQDLQSLSGVGDTIEFLKENFDIKDKDE